MGEGNCGKIEGNLLSLIFWDSIYRKSPKRAHLLKTRLGSPVGSRPYPDSASVKVGLVAFKIGKIDPKYDKFRCPVALLEDSVGQIT